MVSRLYFCKENLFLAVPSFPGKLGYFYLAQSIGDMAASVGNGNIAGNGDRVGNGDINFVTPLS